MEKLCNVFKTGINYINYGKANYALEILKYGTVRKEFGDMLTKQPDLVKNLEFRYRKTEINECGRKFQKTLMFWKRYLTC